jgi:hypothetical protein
LALRVNWIRKEVCVGQGLGDRLVRQFLGCVFCFLLGFSLNHEREFIAIVTGLSEDLVELPARDADNIVGSGGLLRYSRFRRPRRSLRFLNSFTSPSSKNPPRVIAIKRFVAGLFCLNPAFLGRFRNPAVCVESVQIAAIASPQARELPNRTLGGVGILSYLKLLSRG